MSFDDLNQEHQDNEKDFIKSMVDGYYSLVKKDVSKELFGENIKDLHYLESIIKKKKLSFRFSKEHKDILEYSFNKSCSKGPLCNEPSHGVAVILDNFFITHKKKSTVAQMKKVETNLWNNTQIRSDLINTLSQGIENCLLGSHPRLVMSILDCTAYCTDQTQNNYCEIIKTSGGRILDNDFKPEVNLIEIKSTLPFHESFGFYGKVLQGTSGEVIPQLNFAGWEVIDEDPFFEERMTKEQREDFGEDVKLKNYARDLMNDIRKRKGLATELKITKEGDKQNTLGRKK
jgi:ribosome assembly protein 1